MTTPNDKASLNQAKLAADLGISPKTVSLALRGKPGVKPGTRQAVIDLARQEGYQIDPARRGNRRRQRQIGVCFPDFDAHYGDLCHNLSVEASRRGWLVIPQATLDNPADERRAVEMFTALNVDSVILTSSRIGREAVKELRDKGILVIAMIGMPPNLQEQSAEVFDVPILLDHFSGTFKATRYLIELGHRQIAFLSGPRNSSTNQAKLKGYERALSEGLGNDHTSLGDHIIRLDRQSFDYHAGFDACSELLTQGESVSRPTAIICYNDELAIGALRCLAHNRVKLPEQMSVVGNDDIRAAMFANPPLTTIRVPRYELALQALDILDRYFAEGAIYEVPSIEPELIKRGSTSPPLGLQKRTVTGRVLPAAASRQSTS